MVARKKLITPRVEDPINLANWKSMVGKKVCKYSGKPFLSRLKENTVKDVDIIHPITGRLCFTFEEDVSYVECRQCLEVTEL
jgi:hypothetical protein